jgi:hypothetical protein
VPRVKVFALFLAIIGAALLAFNNCSEVGFQNTPESKSVAPTGSGGGDLSQDEIDDIISRLPPDEVNNPIPVSELENDPTLYDRYKCPDSDGVVICHFPDNVEDQHTQCIGRPAVPTHYDHIRDYVKDGATKEIGDYLGPCRVAL